MARRNRGKSRPAPLPGNRLIIKVMGDPGTGKTTALKAIRLLLEDAGAEVCAMSHGGPGDHGEDNMLSARTSPEILRELRAWMEDQPA